MTDMALWLFAWAKSSLKSLTTPKKFGFCTTTQAVSSPTAARRASMSLVPFFWGTVTISMGRLVLYVASMARHSGFTQPSITTFSRWVRRQLMAAASKMADPPS